MRARVGLLVLGAALLPGCRGARREPAALGIVPSATAAPGRLAAGHPVAVSVAFRVDRALPRVAGPHRVFLHLVDREGALLAADHFRPTPALAEWEAGRTYTFRRTLLTPEFPYAGEVTILTGLYAETAEGERLALEGRAQGRRAYRAGGLTLLPRARELALDCEGLHEPEAAAGSPFVVTRFMTRNASCRFANPREELVLFLSADLDPRGFARPPRLSIQGRTGFGLELPLALGEEPQLLRVRIPAPALGRREQATLDLTMSESYVPRALGAGSDPRELSLRILGAALLRASRADPALLEGASVLARAQ